MDCTTRDRDESELFLVEGDSAGGSRPRAAATACYQAILPLRGKVLNVEKARLEKLLENEEISSLIAAIGVDIGNVEDVSKVPLRQDHHPDRRRRGRPAHPHAAADVLLPPDAEADRGRAHLRRPAAAVQGDAEEGERGSSRPARRWRRS